jgi:hypothetical protein
VAVATHSRARAAHVEEAQTAGSERLFEPRGDSFEDVILEVWEDLEAGRHADCPVCGGSMSMVDGCGDCGSELS